MSGDLRHRVAALSAAGRRDLAARAGAGGAGERYLAAYVVPRGGAAPTVEELRSFLAEHLPAYMLPSQYVVLAELPRTASGKVDRRALPEPGHTRSALGAAYVAPRSEVEATLAAAWAEVLEVEGVGVDDDFFDLGGDSILSLRLAARIRAAGLAVTPRHLYEHSTIARLAAELAGGGARPETEG
jgi:aryl carrier-like protein